MLDAAVFSEPLYALRALAHTLSSNPGVTTSHVNTWILEPDRSELEYFLCTYGLYHRGQAT